MDMHANRTYMVYDIIAIYSYLKKANVFTSEIHIKNIYKYDLLEGIGISKIDTKNNFFLFNKDLNFDSLTKYKVNFRIKLESYIVDFSTSFHPSSGKDGEPQKFFLPKQMTVQCFTSERRVKPSKDHPIEATFNRLYVNFNVLDISAGGMAIQISNVELLLDVGDVIDVIEIMLTEQETIRVSGEVRLITEDSCRIKFINISNKAERIIAEYMERRELVDIIWEKLYIDVEEEIMKFQEKS